MAAESTLAANRLEDSKSPDAVVRTMDQASGPSAFSCKELWAGNERAHRSFELAGHQADVITVPNGSSSGGDLSAIFSCADSLTRVVLADCVGHGYVASNLARHLHDLLHRFQDIRETASLLSALNNQLTLERQESGGDFRLTTIVTAVFDFATGGLNFADAANPRMLFRRAGKAQFSEIGRDLVNFPLGFEAGEHYLDRNIHLDAGDMILGFSDGATEVESPSGAELTAEGFAKFAAATLSKYNEPPSLHDFSEALLEGIHQYHGGIDLEDDITLFTLRRSPSGHGSTRGDSTA